MPWTEKQHRLFQAAAHNPEIAKRKGIPMKDAKRMAAEGIKTRTRREDVAAAMDMVPPT